MTPKTKIITGTSILIAAIMFFFLFLGGGVGVYFLTSWASADKTAKTDQTAKEETKKEDQKKTEDTKNQEQTSVIEKNTDENSGKVTYAIMQKDGSKNPLPTSMSGEYGICAINGKLRWYISNAIEDKYRKLHPNDTTFFRGTSTKGENVEAQREGGYTFVDGEFITDSKPKPNKSETYKMCVQFWPINGHWPHLGINDKSLSINSPAIYKFVENGFAGYNVEYEISPLN